MTRNEIEAFFAVVQSGTFSAACDRLYITQPALSRRIKTLEEELGVQLFCREKGKRSVSLTEEGHAFLSLAEKWMSLLGELDSLPRGGGVLRIAAIGSLHHTLLPDIYRSFIGKYPNISLHLSTDHSLEAYRLVADGIVNLAFSDTVRYSPSVTALPFFKERMVLLCKTDSQFASFKRPQELCCDREVYLPWSDEFEHWHRYWYGTAKPYVRTDQMSLLQVFLESADCFCFAPVTVAQWFCQNGGYSFCDLDSPPPDRTIHLLYRANAQLRLISPFFTCLMEFLSQKSDVSLLADKLI